METLKDYKIYIKISTIVAIIAFVVTFCIKIDRLEAKTEHNKGKAELYIERYDETLEQRTEETNKITELTSEVKSINKTLVEMKDDYKEIRNKLYK